MIRQPILIPQPKKFDVHEGARKIGPATADAVRKVLLPFGPGNHIEGIRFTTDSFLRSQEYRLTIDDSRIEISAADELGRWYGIVTLRQLLDHPETGMVPKCSIEDSPDYPVRGAHLDISRDRVPTMETLFRLIDFWASVKYNQVQLYMEHAFAYSCHKKVWENASPLTPDEVRELDGYCKARGIELVPNQNSFGHMERWFRHQEYHYLAESPNGFYDPWNRFRPVGSCIAPVEPKAIPFLEGLYDELLPLFESKTLNIGGDEPWELGQGRSREECEKRGKGTVYLDFLLKIHKVVSDRGYTMQFYGDIINLYPELIPQLPDDVIVVDWGYEADHPFGEECKKFKQSKKQFYVCTGTSSWNTIGGHWKRAKGNILLGAEQGLAHGASGYIVTEWGDNGHWQQLPIGFPAWLYAAGVSWALDANREMDMEAALEAVLTGTLSAAGTGEPFQKSDTDFIGKLAQALMQLEQVPEQEPVYVRNSSVLSALLLDPVYPHYREQLKQCLHRDFSSVKASLEAAAAILPEGTGITEDTEGRDFRHIALLRDEIDFTIRLLQFSCDVAQEQLTAGYELTKDLPSETKKTFISRLDLLIEEYRHIWLQRSRPGGLDDSTARFIAFKEQLQ